MRIYLLGMMAVLCDLHAGQAVIAPPSKDDDAVSRVQALGSCLIDRRGPRCDQDDGRRFMSFRGIPTGEGLEPFQGWMLPGTVRCGYGDCHLTDVRKLGNRSLTVLSDSSGARMGFCTVGLDETVRKCRETAFTDMLWGWNLPFGQISRRLVVIQPTTNIVEVSRNLVGMTPRYMIVYKNVFVRVDSSYGAEQIAQAILCAGLPAQERVRYQKESGREATGRSLPSPAKR